MANRLWDDVLYLTYLFIKMLIIEIIKRLNYSKIFMSTAILLYMVILKGFVYLYIWLW